jgi:hypothetical protein
MDRGGGVSTRLLEVQDSDGLWAGALYSPKWTSTTYTLLLLHRLGLPRPNAQATVGCARLWSAATDQGGGLNLAKTIREPETCITAMLVLLGSAYGGAPDRVERSVGWLLEQQMADGGWNCELLRSGARHGSFHTTISVIEALLEHRTGGGPVDTQAAEVAGREFLLRHRLFRSHRNRRGHRPGVREVPLPAAVALRRPPRARALPLGIGAAGRAAAKGGQPGRRCPPRRRAVATAPALPRSAMVRDGIAGA